MSEKPISPLRQRMLDDMSMRRFVPDTQREYIRAVKKLASFLGRSPDSTTPEELRAFQLHLTETGLQPQSINATVTALRFFFKVTLDRPETTRRLVFVYEPRKLPRVLSPEEVLHLLEAAPGPKHKAALSVAYCAGLRAMEVVALKVCDIDSKRMMIRVNQGKGGKDRHAMLSPKLLELLRDWWRIAHPQVWMFAGRDRINPMTTRQLNRACHMAAELAGLTGHGNAWTQERVCGFRNHHDIAVFCDSEWAERGEITLEAAAKLIGVCNMTALRMLRRGDIKGRQACAGAPWVIRAG